MINKRKNLRSKSTERKSYPLSEVIPLGDICFEGIVNRYNLSIKANDL